MGQAFEAVFDFPVCVGLLKSLVGHPQTCFAFLESCVRLPKLRFPPVRICVVIWGDCMYVGRMLDVSWMYVGCMLDMRWMYVGILDLC